MNTVPSLDAIAQAKECGWTGGVNAAASYMQARIANPIFNALTLRALPSRYIIKTALDVMRQTADFLKCAPLQHESGIVWDEFKNKVQTFSLFEYVDLALELAPEANASLSELVAQAGRLGPYLSVWATEGIGHYYAHLQLGNRTFADGILSGERSNALPPASRIPLHTGMGLALAEACLAAAGDSASDCRRLLSQFVDLCRSNSQEGYWKAAFESLGLVARTLYPHVIRSIDLSLRRDEELLAYFWHGVGRGIYFVPENLPPFCSAPWSAMDMCFSEPPHELGKRNAVAGLAWALMLVNIRQPQIMAAFLKHHGRQLAEDDAFANGVCSATIIWQDASPDDSYVDAFLNYVPRYSDPFLSGLWARYLHLACEDSFRYHSALVERNAIADVFRYQQLCHIAQKDHGSRYCG